jgi:filamentous hemagglutinin
VSTIRGTLVKREGDRNAYQQRVAGGKDRLATDDGGHFLATIFRGAGERINLAPMDVNLNRGAWKAMENEWSAALQRGEEVKVSIDVKYPEGSTRPSRFIVKYQIGTAPPERQIFKNAPGGR